MRPGGGRVHIEDSCYAIATLLSSRNASIGPEPVPVEARRPEPNRRAATLGEKATNLTGAQAVAKLLAGDR